MRRSYEAAGSPTRARNTSWARVIYSPEGRRRAQSKGTPQRCARPDESGFKLAPAPALRAPHTAALLAGLSRVCGRTEGCLIVGLSQIADRVVNPGLQRTEDIGYVLGLHTCPSVRRMLACIIRCNRRATPVQAFERRCNCEVHPRIRWTSTVPSRSIKEKT
jgi:hypothetical protein